MFNEIIKELRLKNKLTTEEVANSIGVSGGAYRNYERGERNPSFEILVKLADFYEVTTDYLLGREEEPKDLEELWTMDEKKLAESMLRRYRNIPEQFRQGFYDGIRFFLESTTPEEVKLQMQSSMEYDGTIGEKLAERQQAEAEAEALRKDTA